MHESSKPFGRDLSNPPLRDALVAEERTLDALVTLAAAGLESVPDAGYHEPSLQWFAAEERRRIGEAGGRAGERQQRVAQRIQAALAARQLRIVCQRGRPILHTDRARPGMGMLETGAARFPHARHIDLGVAAGVGRELWDEPCDTWIDLPPSIAPGEYIGLGVSGDSMEPLMHTGDTILVRIGTELQADTIIVARHPDNGYVVKRVSHLTNTTIHLASLNAGYPVLTLPRDPALVVGTVVMRWCAHGDNGQSSG